MARYANRQSGEAQTFVICGFDSRLRHLNNMRRLGIGEPNWPVTQPSRKAVQVQLLPDALTTWPVRLSVQDASPSSWRGGFDSRTGY